ncbi:hypothetical protein PPYR_09217 [Photinus pyralis]|uniref:Circadian clock-controlled protein n=2 Tax=Photinus pyralis TaxID=7054 RepID=A0A5N4ALN5_PHOPY|nr:uncharacterized protein LOC116172229 [Photinus pyralis]KAB0798224.1 hypothetical protein PPYR_09217 [Photinus pyralis]
MKFYQVIVAISALFSVAAVLPDYIHVCKATDPELAKCINNSINHLRPRFKFGIGDLQVPPMEPLILSEIQLKRGPSAVALDCNITNLKVWGPSSFIVTDLKVNLTKNKFVFKTLIPDLYFKGDYSLFVNILLITIKERGPIEGNSTNYVADVVMRGRKVTVNGEEHLKFDKMKLRLSIGNSKLALGNLSATDPIIKEVTDSLITDNSDLFISEIKPTLEMSLAEKLTEIANRITLSFTYQELFA